MSEEMVAAVAREIAAAVARALEEAEDKHAEDLVAIVAATKAKEHARHEAATKLHAEAAAAAAAAAAETEQRMQLQLEEAWSRAKASASTATVLRTAARQHEATIAQLRAELAAASEREVVKEHEVEDGVEEEDEEAAVAGARPLATYGGTGFRKNDRVAVLYNVDRFSRGDWFTGKAHGSDLVLE